MELLCRGVLLGAALGSSFAVPSHARALLGLSAQATTQQLPLRGLRGADRGKFTLASFNGRFRRSSDVEHARDSGIVSGRSSFTVSGPGLGPTLASECRFTERDQEFAGRAKPRRLDFRCSFERNGKPVATSLTLSNPVPTCNLRSGLFDFEGRRIEVKSVHELAGAKVRTSYPVGYRFTAGGRVIGGIDLSNTLRPIVHAPLRAGSPRHATLVLATALATFLDPARDQDRVEGLIPDPSCLRGR